MEKTAKSLAFLEARKKLTRYQVDSFIKTSLYINRWSFDRSEQGTEILYTIWCDVNKWKGIKSESNAMALLGVYRIYEWLDGSARFGWEPGHYVSPDLEKIRTQFNMQTAQAINHILAEQSAATIYDALQYDKLPIKYNVLVSLVNRTLESCKHRFNLQIEKDPVPGDYTFILKQNNNEVGKVEVLEKGNSLNAVVFHIENSLLENLCSAVMLDIPENMESHPTRWEETPRNPFEPRTFIPVYDNLSTPKPDQNAGQNEQSNKKEKPGRRHHADDIWAWKQIYEDGRDKTEVKAEWIEKIKKDRKRNLIYTGWNRQFRRIENKNWFK